MKHEIKVGMPPTKRNLITAIEEEVRWCKKNIGKAPDRIRAEWFIKGLEQAKKIIKKI
jgi:hypothetical protein